jgi:hypothetical protein
MKTVTFVLLFFCSAGLFAQEVADERGQLVYRLGEKYEIYAYEQKTASYTMRKYTYVIEGEEAGSDEVYVCGGSRTAIGRLSAILERLAETGEVRERAFNALEMRLYTAEDAAFACEALFLKYGGKWRVSLSRAMRIYEKEIRVFRRQYEFY